MDNRLKRIADNLDSMTIGLDEPFKFHCTMCGKCCIDREDILLNPRDIYNMAKILELDPLALFERYCETYLGHDSRIPIVRLRPRGPIKRCPLLKGRKCSVHEAKPTVCAMFPLGRCVSIAPPKTTISPADVKIILDPPQCGDACETHTPREWMTSFGIPIQDEFFVKWQQTILDLGRILRKMEKAQSDERMNAAWIFSFKVLYLCYDMKEAFLPQFEKNTAALLSALRTVKDKGGAAYAE